jgi:membrane protease YdiL (CAAX protease family)
MSVRTLITFFALAFGLSWGSLALLILFQDQMEAIFGEVSATNPLFLLAVYTPGIAGVFLVWRHYGIKGLLSFFKRITLWRMPVAWWVFLVLGIPAIVYAGAALSGTVTDPFPFSPWYGVLSALIFALLLGPMGEEFGWRGVALPLLQRRLAPLWAGLILGVIWGLWHLPAFLLSGTPQSSMSLIPFFIGVVAVAVILTPMFNAARGSILIAMLYHLQVMNPAFPDAQPWDTLMWVIAAVVVVVVNRKAMLSREGAVTEVLMPGEEEGSPNDARIAAAGPIKGKVLPSSR